MCIGCVSGLKYQGKSMEWMCRYNGIDIKATGNKIKSIMESNACSAKVLANSLGVSNQAVYKWLNGQALPSLENLYQISKLFNVKMDDIIVDNSYQEYVLPEIYIREDDLAELYKLHAQSCLLS